MDLCFPKKILAQHAIWLGKTRAGKSSSMRHVVEWLLAHDQRLCIVDPKGDWYGLKLSADGKSAGFKVILFGDFKEATASDVPINDRSGRHIAELIASGNRPCVIGMRGWSNAAQSRFWIDFASTLFNSNLAGGLKLFVDEVQNFAPKERTGIGQESEALGWTKRLLSEGSGLGLTFFCGSQRPASVHNGVLTQCETLVAMRVIHASDRKASKDWIDGNGDKAMGQTVLDNLAGLKRGEAFVWSPEAEFGPERVQFPMFETFDSFAPPQLQKKISDKGWASVDLEAVKEKLATVIEEQKANDPRELKAEVARLKSEKAKLEREFNAKAQSGKGAKPSNDPALKAQIKKLSGALEAAMKIILEITTRNFDAAVPPEQIQKAVESAAESIKGIVRTQLESRNKEFDRLKKQAGQVLGQMQALMEKNVSINLDVKHNEPFTVSPPRRAAAGLRSRNAGPRPQENGNCKLPKAEFAILRVLANFPEGKSKREVGVIAGYKHSGGGFNNAVGALRSLGYVTTGDPLRITDEGLDAHGPVQSLPTGAELFEYWMQHPDLGKAEREILRVLVKEATGERWTKEAIAAQTVSDRGVPYEANGGGFNNAVGRLRTYELIEGKGAMSAVKEFFQ